MPKRKIASKKVCSKKRLVRHTIGTQVTGGEIDEAFENMCENPKSAFDTYNQFVFKRKRQKYPNLFAGGKIFQTSSENLRKQIAYKFGPLIIRKNCRNLD